MYSIAKIIKKTYNEQIGFSARHCFSLEDLVRHVALPSFVKVCRGDIPLDAEAGARLTCHLLLRLFKTVECPQPGMYSVSTSPHPIPTQGPQYSIKLSCDRHLLAAAHKNISVEPILAVLKTILVVGDTTARDGGNSKNNGKRSGLSTPVHPGSTPKGQLGASELSHILGTSDMSLIGAADDPMLDLTMVDLEAGNRHAQRSIFLIEFYECPLFVCLCRCRFCK
ncbi:mediator of RNA polymerase II transcription subunit 12-like [Ctenocephalides felis]|uniref:mediator of RNA polymerase II transcription subunit 12-like n=1 Tax=Ctenocephalides felis TaxID=7515 RepID=UPI000E6E2D8D|nr:mediator of RNA polymerase II transcription subunit 12-like [Ctenocephalides felis]